MQNEKNLRDLNFARARAVREGARNKVASSIERSDWLAAKLTVDFDASSTGIPESIANGGFGQCPEPPDITFDG